jgi:hypothetical protein
MTAFSKADVQQSAGMAYLAGTGPSGKICRDCTHMVFFGKKGHCEKYRSQTRDKRATITGSAAACNKFAQKAPVARKPRPVPPRWTPLPVRCAVPDCSHDEVEGRSFCATHWDAIPPLLRDALTAQAGLDFFERLPLVTVAAMLLVSRSGQL